MLSVSRCSKAKKLKPKLGLCDYTQEKEKWWHWLSMTMAHTFDTKVNKFMETFMRKGLGGQGHSSI